MGFSFSAIQPAEAGFASVFGDCGCERGRRFTADREFGVNFDELIAPQR